MALVCLRDPALPHPRPLSERNPAMAAHPRNCFRLEQIINPKLFDAASALPC